MTFDDWCAAHGAYLNDSDDAARAAKLMARRAWDAAVERRAKTDESHGAVSGPVEPKVRQHTERAKRAAAVLAECGWSVTENDGVSCHKCLADLIPGARYCYQCGEPARNFARGTLDDLEAAIAAAVDGAA